jgi:hypothetical protein
MLEARTRGKILSNTNGMRRTQVTKPGEKIEISLREGRWLIVKTPPQCALAGENPDLQEPLNPTPAANEAAIIKAKLHAN